MKMQGGCLLTLWAGLYLFLATQAGAWPIGPFPEETVSGHRDANNNFAWDYNYFIMYENDALMIDVQLEFTKTGGVTDEQLNALKPIWESGIESMWNNKYYIRKDSLYRIPIVVDLTYDGPEYNYNVSVRPGPERSTMTFWDTEDTGRVAAHEFGHMIGLYDEYEDGATDPTNPIHDNTSIMGSTAIGARPYARHFEGFRSWLAAKDTSQVFELVEVPEPEAIACIALGFIILLMGMERRKKSR